MRGAVVLIGLVLLLCACTPAQGPARVILSQGEIEGASSNGVRRFLSIPYAAAPVGPLRWRAPQPPVRWQGVRYANQFGPSCTQNISATGWGPWTHEFSPQGEVSEDCLSLSVWTPARTANARLPVLFWIPGGGFTDGGEATAVYDGQKLAEHGVIVVSINYRVAAFGLLAHPQLEAEADGARGNYALRDALGALRWVRENIAAFGGDPDQVTIAGQSAGGALVYAMLGSPEAAGLFARAIIQSFPPGSHTFATQAQAEANGAAFAKHLLADTAAQLRAISAEALLHASDDAEFDLQVDGQTITAPNGAVLPLHNDVPVMLGVTADEISWLPETNDAAWTRLNAMGPVFAQLYPTRSDAELRDAVLLSDRHANMVALSRWARARTPGGGAATYLYLWTHAPPGPDAARYRAFHSAEVPYMFGSLDAAPERGFTQADRDIAELTMRYWASFVKTGDPNGDGRAYWPEASREGVFMGLGDHFGALPPLPEMISAYWNARFDQRSEYRF